MESQHQNPEFRINPENFHPCNIVTRMAPLRATIGEKKSSNRMRRIFGMYKQR